MPAMDPSQLEKIVFDDPEPTYDPTLQSVDVRTLSRDELLDLLCELFADPVVLQGRAERRERLGRRIRSRQGGLREIAIAQLGTKGCFDYDRFAREMKKYRVLASTEAIRTILDRKWKKFSRDPIDKVLYGALLTLVTTVEKLADKGKVDAAHDLFCDLPSSTTSSASATRSRRSWTNQWWDI